MARKDAVSKTKAKMRALSSEKDNISSAYLKTTLRLAQSKESEQEAQERMVQVTARHPKAASTNASKTLHICLHSFARQNDRRVVLDRRWPIVTGCSTR